VPDAFSIASFMYKLLKGNGIGFYFNDCYLLKMAFFVKLFEQLRGVFSGGGIPFSWKKEEGNG